jgi:glycerophosphoryl diester phosphodiesterase
LADWQRIAHRGASGHAPENTLAAFRKAVEMGVDGIEMDIRLTADDEVIVLHDASLNRTTDTTGEVSKLSLAQIRQADAGDGERVPTFAEALESIPTDVLAFVEIKAIEATAPAVRIVQEMDRLDQVVIISFNADALRLLRTLDSRMPMGLLQGGAAGTYNNASSVGLDLLHRAQATGTSTVSVNWQLLNPETVGDIQQRGGAVWTWTINDTDDIRRVADMGVQAITSDYPDRLNEALS